MNRTFIKGKIAPEMDSTEMGQKSRGIDKENRVFGITEEPREELTSIQKRNHTIYKLLKHCCILAVWFSMGMFSEIVGPTLPDLAKGIGVNYEKIGQALSTKSIGIFIGSLSGGFIHEVFYKHTELIMSVGILVGALGTVFVPFAPNLDLLAFVLALTGISQGIINTGGNTLVMHLWGDQAAAPMHSVHLFFGIGAFIAPQIAKPFLVDSNTGTPAVSNYTNFTTDIPMINNFTNVITMATTQAPTKSRLAYPYGIITGIVICIALVMLGFYIKAPPEGFPERKRADLKLKTLISPGSCTGGRVNYGIALFAVLFLYFVHATGGERAYGKYLSTYSQESELKFNKQQSSNLASVFWGCHVFGRFSGIFLSRLVTPSFIIAADIFLLLITSVLLATFGFNHTTAIWVLSGLLGYGISLIFPAGMGWANLHLDMNSVGMMIMMMGASTGALVYQYVPGMLIQRNGPKSLMWVMVTYSGFVAVTFIILSLIAKTLGDVQNKVTHKNGNMIDVDAAETVVVVNHTNVITAKF